MNRLCFFTFKKIFEAIGNKEKKKDIIQINGK